MYRLADMYKDIKQRSMKIGWRLHSKLYPNSLAVEYMEHLPDEVRTRQSRDATNTSIKFPNSNFTLLLELVKERAKLHPELMPSDETIVVHLRTGDVVDREELYTLEELLGNYTRYNRPLSYYDEMLYNISSLNINKSEVLLVTAWHKIMDHTRSVMYINEIIKHIQYKFGFNVSLRINQNPDQDFILMCHSKYFIKCGGGFSRLISRMVTALGGTVFGQQYEIYKSHK